MDLLKILFCLNFSLILIHEMDAIRCKEWKMFIFLKEMKENIGYMIFTLAHLPLYFFSLFGLFSNANFFSSTISISVDVLFILHSIIHFLFKNNKNNEFNSIFSLWIINGMALISIIRIIILYKL